MLVPSAPPAAVPPHQLCLHHHLLAAAVAVTVVAAALVCQPPPSPYRWCRELTRHRPSRAMPALLLQLLRCGSLAQVHMGTPSQPLQPTVGSAVGSAVLVQLGLALAAATAGRLRQPRRQISTSRCPLQTPVLPHSVTVRVVLMRSSASVLMAGAPHRLQRTARAVTALVDQAPDRHLLQRRRYECWAILRTVMMAMVKKMATKMRKRRWK